MIDRKTVLVAFLVAGAFALPAVLRAPGMPLAPTSASWDGANWDGAQWDSARWDGSNWDGSNWDGSNWDGSNWDGSNWDGSNWDGSNWDASQWDAGTFTGNDPLYPYQWGLLAARVPGAWALVGPGSYARTVCVIDSGVDATHPDLAPQMWSDPSTGAHGRDFVDDDDDPTDVGGHGTHVASVLAARAGDGYGVAGVANVRVMAVRVLDPTGAGTDGDLALGIRYCVDQGADILTLSLSTDDKDKLVRSAIQHASASGRLVVASVGNAACEPCVSELATLPGVLGVTAIAPDGQLAPFAAWTSKTELAGPGVTIAGAFPGGEFALASGTSQAVPFVSGAAALVWEAAPDLDASDVAKLLRKTATSLDDGSGRALRVVNAEAAVLEALRQR